MNGEGTAPTHQWVSVSLDRPYVAGPYQNGKVSIGITIPMEAGKNPQTVIDKAVAMCQKSLDKYVASEIEACKKVSAK